MFPSTRHRQDKRPLERMSESEVKSKLLLSDKTLAEIELAFKNGTPTLFTQDDLDRVKAANTRMRKRLEDIQTSRLTSSLAGMSVRPVGASNTNGSAGAGNDQRRPSGDSLRLLSTSNGTRTTFIQPPTAPRVQVLDSAKSIEIQNASNAADILARQAGAAQLPGSKSARTKSHRPSQPNLHSYLPTGAFDIESDVDDWMYEDEESEYELDLPELLKKEQREMEARQSDDAYSEAGSAGDYGDLSDIIRVDVEKMTDMHDRAAERASDMQTS